MKRPTRTRRTKLLDAYEIVDARKLLSIFPPGQYVDTTITSPPYWNLKDYGSKNQIGYGQSYEKYLKDLATIFSGIYKITKETGSLWVVADTIKLNGELKLFPFDLAQKLKKVGWVLQDVIVWHKDKTLPWSHRGKLRNIFEYILFFSKGPRFKYYLSRVRETTDLKEWWKRYPERYSPQGKAPTRTWKIAIPRQGSWGENWVRHFCPFPPELVRRIVLLTTKKGDVVLDPFAGSGVVLAQSKAIGRHFIGTDLQARYRTMFQKKVLPSIIALEKTRQLGRCTEERKRKTFSTLIWKLRKTKYPRELLRLYEKSYRKTKVVGALTIATQSKPLRIIYFFTDKKVPPKNFLKRMESLMLQPPLSKYGLEAKIEAQALPVESKISASNGFHSIRALSVYRNGKTYRATDQITGKDFLTSLVNGVDRKADEMPILASNVRVTQREMVF